jgi:hypothetical protein
VQLLVGDSNSYYQNSYLMSLQDPYVNPADNNIIAGHGKTQLECSPGADCEGNPYVVTFTTGSTKNPKVKKVSIDQVTLKSNRTSYFANGLTSCAHVSWSPDGTYLMCTEQHTEDKILNGVGQSASNKKYVEQDNLYVFKKTISSLSLPFSKLQINESISPPMEKMIAYEWLPVDGGPLFKHHSPQKLFDLDKNFKTAKYAEKYNTDNLPSGEYCNSKFQHKLAEFCGESHYIVARVACQTNQYGSPEQFLYSRIYLIDISDKNIPIYHDITGALEDLMGSNPGTWHSQSATCSNYKNSTFTKIPPMK